VAFVSDSLRLPLCLWYQPKTIAAAAILMAYHGCKLKFPIELSTDWGKFLVSNANILSDVVNAIMEVYRLPRKGVISPTEEVMKIYIDECIHDIHHLYLVSSLLLLLLKVCKRAIAGCFERRNEVYRCAQYTPTLCF
jgi:hypothetical protein